MKNRCFRIGLVGAGGISKMHLEGINRHPERAKVTALCDPNPENLKERGKNYNVADLFSNLENFLKKSSIDVAVVCTPTQVRKQVLLPLLETGIPTFCEKPFAETYAEALEITKKAQQHKIPLAINQNFRRLFTFALGRKILEKGKLGKPLHLTQVVNQLRRDEGWRLKRSRYVMTVMSIHWFDGYRYMLNDEPETVYCRAVNSPAIPGGQDTAASVILQFKKGTVVSLTESFSSFTKLNYASLDCEKGGLILEYDKLLEVRSTGEKIEHVNSHRPEATYYLLDNLLQAVEEGDEPETSATDNLKSMRILEAAYHSFEQERVVKMEEIET